MFLSKNSNVKDAFSNVTILRRISKKEGMVVCMKSKLNKNNSLLRVLLIGILLGPAIMLIAAILFAFLALKTGNPTSVVFPIALFAIFIGGFISSLIAAKGYRERPMQAGLFTGVGNLIIVFVVALISSSFSNGFREAIFPPAILILSSVLGTLAGMRLKPSTKRKLKRLRKQVR